MVKYKIVWSSNAEKELFEILTYYIERNKSSRYSKKLYLKLQNKISKLENQPLLGKPIDTELRGFNIDDYLILYNINLQCVQILMIWDNRRDPNLLASRLEAL